MCSRESGQDSFGKFATFIDRSLRPIAGFLCENADQRLRQHSRAGKFLLRAVVQVLANATLFVFGDPQHIPLQIVALADVADDASEEAQVADFADGESDGK